MIPVYCIEDLTVNEIDALIEKGVIFDVTSKITVLPTSNGISRKNSKRHVRDFSPGAIQRPSGEESDS